jgi:hypothetical protein
MCPKRPPFIRSASSGCYNATTWRRRMWATIPQSLPVIARTSAYSNAHCKAALFPFKSHPAPEKADLGVLLLQDLRVLLLLLLQYLRVCSSLLYIMHIRSYRSTMPISSSYSSAQCYCAHVFTKISLILSDLRFSKWWLWRAFIS